MKELVAKYGPEPTIQEANGPVGFTKHFPVLLPMPRRDAKVVQVACGDASSLALSEDGAVFSWEVTPPTAGAPSPKQVITELQFPTSLRTKILIAQISCGCSHSLALSLGGTLYSWGEGTFGELGHGNTSRVRSPKQVQYFQDHFPPLSVSKIATGWRHSVVATSCGQAFTWGYSATGALGLGMFEQQDGDNAVLSSAVNSPGLVGLQGYFVTDVFAATTSTIFATVEAE
jgi:alpha-tubulin suppressor-like RCC1 family protein